MTSASSSVPSTARMRALVRDACVVAGALVLAPLWLIARLERRFRRGDGWFAGCSELLSLVPGRPGVMLRRSFYWMTLDHCASDCSIGFGTTFAHPQAEVHEGVYVGNRCTIGSAILERDVTIGSNVDVLSGRRQHGTLRRDVPVQQQAGRFDPVRIGRNSWIGNGTVIMADVGQETVIGAGAVVVHAVDAAAVAVGNPARIVKQRAA